jgi:D-glycero-alpha-D-manno-heptose 1-phosphate guanylyltransferase
MIREAIILAGGLGTRLRSVVAGLPKCMAIVAGKPFLFYVINHLQKQGIEKFIFSVGYKYEFIEDYLKKEFPELQYQLSIEDEPLGTGGAIRLGCTRTSEQDVLALNGDTLFGVDIHRLIFFHHKMHAECSLTLKPMHDFDRYGAVELNDDHSIRSFNEKQFYESGLINGGVYALNVSEFIAKDLGRKFSFEKDYLEKYVEQHKIFGIAQDEYFIDIGIPEDYERAQIELRN